MVEVGVQGARPPRPSADGSRVRQVVAASRGCSECEAARGYARAWSRVLRGLRERRVHARERCEQRGCGRVRRELPLWRRVRRLPAIAC